MRRDNIYLTNDPINEFYLDALGWLNLSTGEVKKLELNPGTVEIAKRRYRPRAGRLHRAQIECQGRQRRIQ